MTTTNGYQVHPAADIFPMLDDDELRELSLDIQNNGQRFPIMLDHQGEWLIDGRNRLAACQLLNIEPIVETLPAGEDPLAYIASVNLHRRNISKGQQAMALAMIYPEDSKGGRGKKNKEFNSGFSAKRLQQARSVLRFSRPLADEVISGTTPLNDAVEIVRQQEQRSMSKEAQLERLQKAAPDLAEQVNEERLKINEAIAALAAREQEMRQICESGRHSAEDIVVEFGAHVTAIVQAIDNGEPIVMARDALKQLATSYKLLLDRVGKE
jgi:ParB-like chromosome segregation protein Spo0J